MATMISKLKMFLFMILFRKEAKNMVVFYAYMVLDEKITFEEVPKKLQPKVKAKLNEWGVGEEE